MPRPLPSSPKSTWNCCQGCPNKNVYECMGTWLLTIFLDSFSALFDRNRSESSFGRQISGQFSIEWSHIILWRFYLVFVTTWMGKKLSSNTLSTQLSNVLSNFICFLKNSGNSLQDFSIVHRQIWRCNMLTSSNNSSAEFQHCNCVTEFWYGIAAIACCK